MHLNSSSITSYFPLSLPLFFACFALIVGDPLEMVTLEATGYQFEIGLDPRTKAPLSLVLPALVSPDRAVRLYLKHRFPFNSTLKR